MLLSERNASWGEMMTILQTGKGAWHSDCRIITNDHSVTIFFYSGSAFLGNRAQGQVVHGSSAHAAKRPGPLCHARPVECCHPCIPVSDRVYPRAESVHRFERSAGFEREGWCRTTTTKPTYGKGCAKAASFCKPSSSCGLQIRVADHSMQNMWVTSAQIGGEDTGFYKYPDTNTIRFTWVPALAGSSGSFGRSLTTKDRSSSTMPGASICNALLACAPSTTGVLPKRKADRLGLRPLSRRGNGRCAILPRQQRTRTRKQSRPAPAGRAVA